ncbi:hypothetical protein F4774DRAFT_183073 [Daldinia eschscholtzii]|nr:hypothetical protein F4774DRAFT_183073 [Daldinia eschscholtzii]
MELKVAMPSTCNARSRLRPSIDTSPRSMEYTHPRDTSSPSPASTYIRSRYITSVCNAASRSLSNNVYLPMLAYACPLRYSYYNILYSYFRIHYRTHQTGHPYSQLTPYRGSRLSDDYWAGKSTTYLTRVKGVFRTWAAQLCRAYNPPLTLLTMAFLTIIVIIMIYPARVYIWSALFSSHFLTSQSWERSSMKQLYTCSHTIIYSQN